MSIGSPGVASEGGGCKAAAFMPQYIPYIIFLHFVTHSRHVTLNCNWDSK
jgi:hypothetical protein